MNTPWAEQVVGWSADEAEVLSECVHRAPPVHTTRPWQLEFADRTAVLRERRDVPPPPHDPEGRDRKIACGAALTNLVAAVRGLGWAADMDIAVSADGAVTASVTGPRRSRASDSEAHRFRAIGDRRVHEWAFGPRPVPPEDLEAVRDVAASPAVGAWWVGGGAEALGVARLLDYAARAYHANLDYQRELTMWTTWRVDGAVGLSAGGAARVRVPDEFQLAARIEREAVLVLATRTDGPESQVRAGEAVQAAWLEATTRGLAASLVTQPLHLSEVRTGLADRLDRPGVPQALMRFGHPAARPGDD
ncbi:nitroreductase family protein [Saccharopolyspora rosea]|uniref:hypothetical protein n=1 Tax=Saccharopolyspora rosea TaxID=524884 RepID=UPI0021D7E5BD|nr:hypothetical protein [Saccharopolyspora rosea]